MSKISLGIVGYGDFTKLMLRHLNGYADVWVSSRSRTEGDAGFGVQFADNAKVLACDVIVPSIPAQHLEEFINANKQHIRKDNVWVDVCSIKIKPLQTLQRCLYPTNEIIGTHPLFGPSSTVDGLAGHKIMVHNVCARGDKYAQFKQFLTETLHLRVIECSPEEHDQAMAYSLGLSHFIGRVMDIMDIPKTPLATQSYEDLLDMRRIQGGDSWDLFISLMTENPYSPEVLQAFHKACKELDSKINT